MTPAGAKLVVGLGNPGPRYAQSRHNAGFRAVEDFARACGLSPWVARFDGLFSEGRCRGHRVVGLLPQTFMNCSGASVAVAVDALGLDGADGDLIVAVDDLDLPLGRLRFRPGGSSGGHRGLESLIEHLGHSDFGRLRIGIGRPPEHQDPVGYVLEDFSSADEACFGDVLARAVQAIQTVICEGVGEAMSHFNRADTDSD